MPYKDPIKEKSKKQQKLCSILRDPRFRSQFMMLGNHARFWEGFSNYLSQNIWVIDKLFDEYKKDELKHLHDKIEELEHEYDLLERATRGYRNGKAKRDVEIMKLHAEYKNLTEISKEVGMTRQGVKKVLLRLEVN